jgi:putative nucleotidyltransferase with HDIG domain
MNETKNLLFLDDEPNILNSLKRVFFDDDFDIVTFTTGKEAIEYLKDNEVSLIISDQRMPGMTGTEMLSQAKEISPDTIRIILTGFADMDAAVDAINSGQIFQFVFKPWNDEEIRSLVVRALEHRNLKNENKNLVNELRDLNAQLGVKVKERTTLIVQKNVELGKLNRTLESSLVKTIRVFSNLIEISQPAISKHTRRVTSFATTLAKNIGWEEKQIKDLEVAALLHDVGKLGIPDSLIGRNPNSLNDVDRKTLNNHPLIGQNMFGAIDSFDKIGKIIRSHHEKWDGTGFPDGLKGEEIPIEARLISLCNHYDHLKNDKDNRSIPFINKFFKNNSGLEFDPSLSKQFQNEFIKKIEQSERSVEDRKARVLPSELKPGMILAENLLTGKGIFLLPEGQLLKETHIRSIRDIQRVDSIPGTILVLIDR